MNRNRELEDHIKEFRKRRIMARKNYLKENNYLLNTTFCSKLTKLILDYEKGLEPKKPIKSIYLCHLRSSDYTGSYVSIIGLGSELLYLDKKKIQTYWFPDVIYDDIIKSMIDAEKVLREKFVRLQEYELFYIKQRLLSDTWGLLLECFIKLANENFELLTKSTLEVEKEFLVLYGDYKDRLKTICIINGGRGNDV